MASVEETNKALAREFLDVLSNADIKRAGELCAEDVEFWVAGSLPFSGSRNKADALKGMAEVLPIFPDGLAFRIKALTAEGERVAIEASGEAKTARGDLYQQEYHFLLRARDGKVLEWREYFDTERARRDLVGE